MSRRVAALALVLVSASSPAFAQEPEFGKAEKVEPDPAPPAPAPAAEPTPADDTAVDTDERNADGGVRDQELGARAGLVSGGRVTPGGLRVGGHYLYQLTDDDWFDGALLFTFGGGPASCFRDREDDVVCDHGRLEGFAGELAVGVRRFFPARGGFLPYARVGAALRVVRFGDDDVTGLAAPLTGGAGIRIRVAPWVAVAAEAQLELGAGVFSRGLGLEPQAGLAVGSAVEFALP
jgi:hypothetical protein